jgi:hypothetical protein
VDEYQRRKILVDDQEKEISAAETRLGEVETELEKTNQLIANHTDAHSRLHGRIGFRGTRYALPSADTMRILVEGLQARREAIREELDGKKAAAAEMRNSLGQPPPEQELALAAWSRRSLQPLANAWFDACNVCARPRMGFSCSIGIPGDRHGPVCSECTFMGTDRATLKCPARAGACPGKMAQAVVDHAWATHGAAAVRESVNKFLECPVCFESMTKPPKKPVMLSCGHVFCTPCINSVMSRGQPCPNCRAVIRETSAADVFVRGIIDAVERPSCR